MMKIRENDCVLNDDDLDVVVGGTNLLYAIIDSFHSGASDCANNCRYNPNYKRFCPKFREGKCKGC